MTNLGGDRAVRLLRLVQAIEGTLGVAPRVAHQPKHPGEPPIARADIAKAKNLMGYSTSMTLEEGLPRFMARIKEKGKAAEEVCSL